MLEYTLHGEKMTDLDSMHDELQRCFMLPKYYGRNLDALWDVLTETDESRQIVLNNTEQMPTELFSKLAALFLNLCRAQDGTTFHISSDQLIPGVYRHFKGREYRLLYIALHSETLEPLVVYQALYGSNGIWVRPAAMWNETIEKDGEKITRFTRIRD